MTDELNHTTITTYDALGRQISQELPASAGEDPIVTSWTYDADGNVLIYTDPDGNPTQYVYDALDRQVTETISLEDPITHQFTDATRTSQYDDAGNLGLYIDRDGKVTRYTYDALNRKTKEEWAQPSTPTTFVTAYNYVYNNDGTLAEEMNPSGIGDDYEYDALGRVKHDMVSTGDINWGDIDYTYDANGRRSSMKAYAGDPGWGSLTNYTYDADGNLTGMTQTGVPDDDDPVPTADKRVDYTYDLSGRLTLLQRYDSLDTSAPIAFTSYSYYNDNTLQEQADVFGALASPGASIDSYEYTYDLSGMISSETDTGGTSNTITYDYDDSYQLTATTNSNLTGNDEDFTYDAAGNRTGNTILANNRLIDDGTYTYTYDKEGDLLSKTDETTGDVWTYTYDNRHRLTQVHADGPTVGHQLTPIGYDEKGNVYNVNGPNFFDGTTPVSGYHSTGVNNGDFVLYFANPISGQVLSYDPDNWSLNPLGTRWMLTDAQGSTRAVITGSTVADRITYSSFGSITSETASAGLDQPTFTYEGMVDPRQGWNAASGLLLDHARLYDPNTSRFLTPDPSPSTNNDALNLYRYAWNDPVNLFDPTGTSATRNYFGSADYNLSLSGYSTRGSSVSVPSYNFTSSTSSFSTSLTPYYSSSSNTGLSASGAAFLANADLSNPYLFTPGASLLSPSLSSNQAGQLLASTSGIEVGDPTAWMRTGGYVVNQNGIIQDRQPMSTGLVQTMGAFQAAGGLAQVITGIGSSEFGIGVGVAALGVDNLVAGLRTAFTGQPAGTAVGTVARATAQAFGASDPTAQRFANVTELGINSVAGMAATSTFSANLLTTRINSAADLINSLDVPSPFMSTAMPMRTGLNFQDVQPYEVGAYNNLAPRSIGDNLDIHHVGQGNPMSQIVPDYDYNIAPSIAIPRGAHLDIPTIRGTYSGTARDLLANDIQNLRIYTKAPNSSLQQLIKMNKRMYPEAFKK